MGCTNCDKETNSEFWMNKKTQTWWRKNEDTKVEYSGEPGKTPVPNETTGTWWIGNVDTGKTYLGEAEITSPEDASNLF